MCLELARGRVALSMQYYRIEGRLGCLLRVRRGGVGREEIKESRDLSNSGVPVIGEPKEEWGKLRKREGKRFKSE